MAEYINRKEALHKISINALAPIAEVYKAVEAVPVADVQPVKHGEWTAEGNDEKGNYWDECTVCRDAVWFPPFVKNDYKYCPHCGARMGGEEDG